MEEKNKSLTSDERLSTPGTFSRRRVAIILNWLNFCLLPIHLFVTCAISEAIIKGSFFLVIVSVLLSVIKTKNQPPSIGALGAGLIVLILHGMMAH